MCGRYMITSSFEAMARLFGATLAELGPEEQRLNVSPTEPIPVCVSHEGDRALVPMRWGLVPPWYRAPNGGPLLINARAEGDRHEAGVPRRDPRAALPDPGRRLLRVAGREGRAQSLGHPPARRRAPRLRRALAGLARRSDLRHRHLSGQRPPRADPRPDAGDGRSRRLRALARRGRPGRRAPDAACVRRPARRRAGRHRDMRGPRAPRRLTGACDHLGSGFPRAASAFPSPIWRRRIGARLPAPGRRVFDAPAQAGAHRLRADGMRPVPLGLRLRSGRPDRAARHWRPAQGDPGTRARSNHPDLT